VRNTGTNNRGLDAAWSFTPHSVLRIPHWLRDPQIAACLAALLLVTVAATPAQAWDDQTHQQIAAEAVARLPEPLQGLFSGEALKRLQAGVLEPDQRTAKLKEEKSPQYQVERVKHFFDIDAITSEPYPFKDFPRDRKAAEAKFGAKAFEESGTVPWTTEDALAALTDALKRQDPDAVFRAAGDLAHYAADLHQPLHVTKNYDGQLTGQKGVHARLEIGLQKRYTAFYAEEIKKDRTEPVYLTDPEGSLFDWLIKAGSRAPDILAADTAARQATGFVPLLDSEEAKKEADDVDSPRAKPYYAAFKKEMESRGSPEAVAMREAAAHLADLYYTAWTNSGKPISLTAAPAQQKEVTWTWLLPMIAVVVVLLLLPRRQPMPQKK
jgi:hypothetical protein